MRSSAFTIAALVALVAAQPHQHRRMHQKRDDIVWVTETDVVWETIEMTTTIWIDDDATPVPAAATPTLSTEAQFYQSYAQPQEDSSSTYVAPAATSSPAYVAPSPSSTSVYVAPVTTSAYVAPIPVESTTSEAAPALVESATSEVAPTPVESTTSQAAPAPIESTTSEAAPVASSIAPSDASTVSPANPSATTCTSAAPCSGDMTYYDASAGTGACGWNNDTMTEAVIALPYEFMGTQSNGNSYCGKTVTISYGGKTVEATVVDKCMGCKGKSIDLSNHAFDQLAEESLGRVTCEWYFN